MCGRVPGCRGPSHSLTTHSPLTQSNFQSCELHPRSVPWTGAPFKKSSRLYFYCTFPMFRYTNTIVLQLPAIQYLRMLHRLVAWEQWAIPHSLGAVGCTTRFRVCTLWCSHSEATRWGSSQNVPLLTGAWLDNMLEAREARLCSWGPRTSTLDKRLSWGNYSHVPQADSLISNL